MAFKRTCPTLAKVGEDEPIFVLRGQDKLAAQIVRAWAGALALEMAKPSSASVYSPERLSKIREALDCADEMERWQANHACKIPD